MPQVLSVTLDLFLHLHWILSLTLGVHKTLRRSSELLDQALHQAMAVLLLQPQDNQGASNSIPVSPGYTLEPWDMMNQFPSAWEVGVREYRAGFGSLSLTLTSSYILWFWHNLHALLPQDFGFWYPKPSTWTLKHLICLKHLASKNFISALRFKIHSSIQLMFPFKATHVLPLWVVYKENYITEKR